jgi:hypothetical protein
METLGVSLVTWTAKAGPIETAPARAAAVFVAMSAAREAVIKEFEADGDDLEALIRATAAAMQVATAAMPTTPAATMAQPSSAPSQRGVGDDGDGRRWRASARRAGRAGWGR